MVHKETIRFWEKFKQVFGKENQQRLSAKQWEELLNEKLLNELFVKQISHKIPTRLYRGRLNPSVKHTNFNFNNTSDLWAPPKNICSQGRCNKKGQSLLYCSTDPNTIIYELKPNVNDEITIIEFDCIENLGPLTLIGIKEIIEKHKDYSKNINKYYEDLPSRSQLVDFLLGYIFKSDIDSSFPKLYDVTNAITSIYLDNQKSNFIPKEILAPRSIGIVYPSVTYGDYYGVNVALIPDQAMHILKPIISYKYKIVEKNKKQSYKLIRTHITSKINKDGKMKWSSESNSKVETVGHSF